MHGELSSSSLLLVFVCLEWDISYFVQVTWHRGAVDSTRYGTRAMLKSTFQLLHRCLNTSRRHGFHSSLIYTSSSVFSRPVHGLSSRKSMTNECLVSFYIFVTCMLTIVRNAVNFSWLSHDLQIWALVANSCILPRSWLLLSVTVAKICNCFYSVTGEKHTQNLVFKHWH